MDVVSCVCVQTKVVILGQDPYHGVRQAHGLSAGLVTYIML